MSTAKPRGHTHLTAIALAALIACTLYTRSVPTGALQQHRPSIGARLNNGFVSDDGAPFNTGHYQDTALVLVEGSTGCPGVCPATLQRWHELFQKLPVEDADRLQLLLLSVDPVRDTPEILGQYLAHFDARFVGLSADPETLRSLLSELHTFAGKIASPALEHDSIDHSGSAYLINAEGQWVDEIHYNSDRETVLAQIARLLDKR